MGTKTWELLVPVTESITQEEYEFFVTRLPHLARLSPDISGLKNDVEMSVASSVASILFESLINTININLSNPEKGIAVVDIPSSKNLNATQNAYWGVALALSLTTNIFRPARDRVNDTPYTIYAASHRHSRKLTDLGLPPIAPETKLGFHTDGLITEGRVAMPQHIMLYNVAIEYEQPGNFYWIPFSLWEEKNRYMNLLGIGNRYEIALTPSIYERDDSNAQAVLHQHVQVPIFVDNPKMSYPMYLNGTVTARADGEQFDEKIVQQLKASLTENRRRFTVPQKTRRVIFARNVVGAHARDVFESPRPGANFTRVFMRSVDTNCIELN